MESKIDGKRGNELAWVPLKRAAEMLGVKPKTLHNRIARGDFRYGQDICKPMGRVLVSVVAINRLIQGTHPCQRRQRFLKA